MKKRGTIDSFNTKKGQITIFIILGILILLIGGVYLYQQAESSKVPFKISEIKEVPSQASPIQLFTQECIYSVASEGLRKLGWNGGYINPDDAGIFSSAIIPTEADAVQFTDTSDIKIPYWWYLKSSNKCAKNCLFSSKKPALEKSSSSRTDFSVESQLSWYLKDHLKQCLDGYSAYVKNGYVVSEKGELNPVVVVEDYGVSVYVEYPLEIKLGSAVMELSQFYVSLPVSFKKIYSLASALADAEKEFSFLERHTLNLISAFSSLDDDGIPPITQTTFELSQGKIWPVISVKQKMEGILSSYVSALQVYNVQNYNRKLFPENDVRQAFYDQSVLPMNLEKEYNSLEAGFDYLGWPIYFDAGSKGIIKPESAILPFINFGVQRYSTTYDISFPAMVTIKDPLAFNGEGYYFVFALEANIRNNRPIDESFKGLAGISSVENSLMCNQNQRTSGNITVELTDIMTGKPASSINVLFACGDETCSIGKTDEKGILKSRFPVCYNGAITFFSTNYFIPAYSISTKLDEDVELKFDAAPVVEKEIDVRRWVYSSYFGQLAPSPVDLEQKEQATVILTRLKQVQGEEDFVASATVYGNQTSKSKLKLVPGIYEARIINIMHKDLFIPKEERKASGPIPGMEEEYDIPEISINNSYPSGGAYLTNNSGYLVISSSDLYNNDRINFYTITPTTPQRVEDLELIGRIEELSLTFRPSLEPSYSNR